MWQFRDRFRSGKTARASGRSAGRAALIGAALLFAIAASVPAERLTAAEPIANAAAAAPAVLLNGRAVALDRSGKIIPWTEDPRDGYDRVVFLSWDLLTRRMPIDPTNGLPVTYTHSEYDPATLQGSGWPNNPGSKHAMLAESAVLYFAYSGDRAVIDLVRGLLDHHLAHGTTPSDYAWAKVPYATGLAGSIEFGNDDLRDGAGVVEPDKLGELGHDGYLNFYKVTGDEKYLNAAIACANALASHVRAGDAGHSPWPFRVDARSGATAQGEEYCAHVIAPIKLFDELIRLGRGNTTAYQKARATAWTWLLAYPLRNNAWANYFEDVPPQSDVLANVNQYAPGQTARYLLQHPEKDPQWRAHAASLLQWIAERFGRPAPGDPGYGATVIGEQMQYDYKMASHTSRFAAAEALYYALTGDKEAEERAYRSLNWCTYMCRDDGAVMEGPTEATVNPMYWFSDGHGDYIRHFLLAMGAVPEWAPAGQNHLLASTSVVADIRYGEGEIEFAVFDSGSRETLRLAFAPVEVRVDGALLPRRDDLTAPGWSFDATAGVLRIRHDRGKQVRVSGAAAAVALTIDAARRFQTIDGFGVNANHRSWKGDELKPVLDQIMHQADMSLLRVVFDNADWEATNDNADAADFNWDYYNKVFAAPKFQPLWEMLAYLEQQGAADGICLCFMGPGPAWMGGQTLTAGMEDEWAETVAALLIYARKTRGLQFTLVSPSNEPDILNEGVHMSGQQYAAALGKLAVKLDANGLGDIRYVAPDAAGTLGYLHSILDEPAALAKIHRWGVHSYGNGDGSDAAAQLLRESAAPERGFWMTEFNVWLPGADGGERGVYDWAYCRGTAEYLLSHLDHGACGAIVWEGYDSYYAHPPATWSFWGIVGLDDEKAAVKHYTPRKNFYTLAQISRFVRPGMQRIAARDDSEPLIAQAFVDPRSSAVTIVGINRGDAPVHLHGSLKGIAPQALQIYATNAAALNLTPLGAATIGAGAFSARIPADCVFTLTSAAPASAAAADGAKAAAREVR